MNSHTYRAVIVGSGRIAGGLEDDPLRRHPCTHIGAYRRFPQIEVTACSSRRDEEALEFAERWGIPRYYSDYREMLEGENADIVSVCTPAKHHYEAVIQAAKCGARAVFCEKAIATSLEEADEMISECRRKGTRLTVNHSRRWCWDFHAVKQIIDSRELGALHSITGWFNGSLVHTGTHFFDVIHYFCGDARSVRGIIDESREHAAGDELRDGDGYALIELNNGVYAFVNGVSKSYYIFEMELLFSDGRIRIGNGIHELWRPRKSRQYKDFMELEQDRFPKAPSGERNPLVLAVRDIIGSIEEDRETASTGDNARQALETAFAVFVAGERGGEPLTLPLQERSLEIVSK